MDNNNKIEIKHSAFIILPIIALIISVIGELLCFLEGIPLSGKSWMPVFWLITILAIPVIAIIFFVVGLIFSLFALIIQNCDGISFPSIFSSTYIILFGDNKRNSKSPFCASLSLKFLFVLNVSLFFKENSS